MSDDVASSATSRVPVGAYVLAGLAAGAVVGFADGVRAALQSGLSARGVLATALLTVSADALIGLVFGTITEALVRARAWGERGNPAAWASVVGALVAGAAPAFVGVVTVMLTARRVNRFLAGGVVAGATLAAALFAVALAPACARLLAAGRVRSAANVRRAGPAWFFAAVAMLLLDAVVFVLVWRTRAPLRRDVLIAREILVAVPATLLPLAAWVGARLPWSLSRRVLAAMGGAAAVAVAAAVVARWNQDLRFVPWEHGLAAVAILGLLVLFVRRPRWPSGGRRALVLLVGVAGAAAALLVTAGSEPARKAVSLHAGLVGPLLAEAQTWLDRDRDGAPALLGGGDCDDANPAIHPAALDWPEDGIDQDCDGRDAEVGALASPPLFPVPDSVPRDLDILFVTIDTLRADHLGAYGYGRPTSPEIDGVAREGTVFENGWAHAPSTRYSMPAIALGRWPSAIAWEDCTACDSWWPRLPTDRRTLGEAMKAAGYTTAGFFAYNYFKREWRRGFERGMDEYQDARAALHVNVSGPAESVGSSAREISDDVVAYLDAHKDAGKLFLWVHYYDPHLNFMKHPEVPDFGGREADLYDNEIRFTDLQLGRVFAALKAHGRWGRTAVVITGDHGEGLGERGIAAHGYHLYPPQTKVPFIVRVPGLPPQRVNTPVGHVDLAPTLVNLARGAHEPSFLGRSMVDLLAGAPAAPAPSPWVFQEVTYENNNAKRALVTETHQLVWNWTPHNTTECFRLADGLEGPDLWGTPAGEPACSALKADVRRRVALLSLPVDFRDKVGFAVVPAGETVPSPGHVAPAGARFGEHVRFLGFDTASLTVDRGTPLEVVYHFEVLRPLDGWKPFLHLVGPGGNTVGNLDHVPAEGAYPSDRWRAGQRIRDRHRFTVSPTLPPGAYELRLGFWKGSERLPLADSQLDDSERRLRAVSLQVR